MRIFSFLSELFENLVREEGLISLHQWLLSHNINYEMNFKEPTAGQFYMHSTALFLFHTLLNVILRFTYHSCTTTVKEEGYKMVFPVAY